MIKNERQYRITRAQADRFEEALAEFGQDRGEGSGGHPLLRRAQAEAMQSQLDDLHSELAEYEELRSGKRRKLELDSLDGFARALVQARIAAGLTQKQLAERLGLKEQQIQRYEATDYASASLSRLKEVVAALGIEVREQVLLPASR